MALDVLTAKVKEKFPDRVIANAGLCVCLHSYESSIGDPCVYPSDGAAHYKARGVAFPHPDFVEFWSGCARKRARTPHCGPGSTISSVRYIAYSCS